MVEGSHQLVHFYPPWEYPLMAPFAVFSKHVAQYIYLTIGVLCAVLLVAWSVIAGLRLRGRLGDGFVCGAIAVMPAYYIVYCLNYLNFGVMIAFAAVCLVCCLDRRRHVLAGVCWALMMVKPQIAALFAIPLLVGRRHKVIAVATVTCLLLATISAVVCDRSPLSMIAAVAQCHELFPKSYLLGPVAAEWLQGFSPSLPLWVNVAIGTVACLVLSWKFRGFDSWMMRLLPALMLCWQWSVSRFYDQSVLLVTFVLLALWLIGSYDCQWRVWLILGALALDVLMLQTPLEAYLAWVFLAAAGCSFAWMAVAQDGLNRELAFVVFICSSFLAFFPHLSGDVALPVLALSSIAVGRDDSRPKQFSVAALVVPACMAAEMSQWALSAIPYYVEIALLYLCASHKSGDVRSR